MPKKKTAQRDLDAKVVIDLKTSEFLIVFFESLFGKLKKLIDEDPEGFAYVAMGALAGGG